LAGVEQTFGWLACCRRLMARGRVVRAVSVMADAGQAGRSRRAIYRSVNLVYLLTGLTGSA
jgi:hypothetical protein